MQRGKIFTCASIDGKQFAGVINPVGNSTGILPGTWAFEHIPLPSAVAAAQSACVIRAVTIIGTDDFTWEVDFYSTKDGANADPNSDSFRAVAVLSSGNAYQDPQTGLWVNYLSGLDMSYWDASVGQAAGVGPAPSLHVRIVNREATVGHVKQSYGAGDHFRLIIDVEPTLAF